MTNILVIDDEKEITSMLELVLAGDTCRVRTAHNGREGLQLLRRFPFDLVITDIIMPEVDGFEVIMEINKMPERPQVIVITGGTMHLSREYLAEVAKTLSVEHILYKPFSIDDLLDMIFPEEVFAIAAAG